MRIEDMRDIKECRKNLVAFLHISDITKINSNLANDADVSNMKFYEICDLTLKQYEENLITNKKASIIFNILAEANKHFKKEQFRLDGTNTIFKFNKDQQAYVFYCKGGKNKLYKLEREFGKYC